MFSYPSHDAVLPELGDKVVGAVAAATGLTRADLALYRDMHPDWVRAHSERGLANWVHDRMWDHLGKLLDGSDGVELIERGVDREIRIGLRYVARVKRHDRSEKIRTYPTRSAIAFWAQSSQLEGLEEVSLAFGYRWDVDARAIRGPVISLRDGHNQPPIWLVELDEEAGQAGTPISYTPIEPTLPQIDLYEGLDDAQEGGEPS